MGGRYWFDAAAAEFALSFFRFLRHSKGEWRGSEFKLEPWQQFIVAQVFGWKRADGARRFRTVYIEVPRKNGKSQLAAAIGLLLLVADKEPGAEVYSVATKLDQARIVWSEASRMTKSSPALAQRVKAWKTSLTVESTASTFAPLGADHSTLDGLNTHGVLVDEVHAHRAPDLLDVMETSTGARRQPLVWMITTAGHSRTSVCWAQHSYLTRVLERSVADDTYFGIIYALDEGDDWRHKKVWRKANPNWGVSVKPDDLERKAVKARQIVAQQNNFRRLHLNEWTEQESRWLDQAVWSACGTSAPEDLAGRVCYAALDLSSVRDYSALALVFPPEQEGEKTRVLCELFIPRERLLERSRAEGVPVLAWVEEGWLTPTEGNIIDYDVIRERLLSHQVTYDLREVAYDPYGATKLVTTLQGDGFNVCPFRQGFLSFNPAMQEFERILTGRQLEHYGNPALAWMASNVTVETDAAGNIKPSKRRSAERIDGIVATVMAIGRATLQAVGESRYYEASGVTWA